MIIQEGKCYKTAKGDKVGPMVRWGDYAHPWQEVEPDESSFRFSGAGDIWSDEGKGSHGIPDLVAEWSEPTPQPLPVRSVTRLEIADGQVGQVSVYKPSEAILNGEKIVALALLSKGLSVHIDTPHYYFSAEALRHLSAVATSLAEALEQDQ